MRGAGRGHRGQQPGQFRRRVDERGGAGVGEPPLGVGQRRQRGLRGPGGTAARAAVASGGVPVTLGLSWCPCRRTPARAGRLRPAAGQAGGQVRGARAAVRVVARQQRRAVPRGPLRSGARAAYLLAVARRAWCPSSRPSSVADPSRSGRARRARPVCAAPWLPRVGVSGTVHSLSSDANGTRGAAACTRGRRIRRSPPGESTRSADGRSAGRTGAPAGAPGRRHSPAAERVQPRARLVVTVRRSGPSQAIRCARRDPLQQHTRPRSHPDEHHPEREAARTAGAARRRAGLDLEEIEVTPAGKRRRAAGRGGLRRGCRSSTPCAELSRAISEALDASDAMGGAPYVLEVTSPGTDRPLTEQRHYRRAPAADQGAARDEGGELIARITRVDDDGPGPRGAGREGPQAHRAPARVRRDRQGPRRDRVQPQGRRLGRGHGRDDRQEEA